MEHQHGFVSPMINYHIQQLHKWAGMQAVPIVKKSLFSRMLIPIAKPAEQVRIAETIQRCENTLLDQIKECQKLTNIKLGIQEALLTGRVSVPETIKEGGHGE